MGACNFGAVWCGIGGAFGQVPRYPSDEEIAVAKLDYDWEEFDDDQVGGFVFEDRLQQCAEDFAYYREAFEDRVREVVSRLWAFDRYGHEYPYEVEMESGYEAGWRVILASRHCFAHERDRTRWLGWCELVDRATCDPEVDCGYGEDAPRVQFEDYCRHLDKVNDAVVWAVEELVKQDMLDVVKGGWVGGARSPTEDDYTRIVYREKWAVMFPQFVSRRGVVV